MAAGCARRCMVAARSEAEEGRRWRGLLAEGLPCRLSYDLLVAFKTDGMLGSLSLLRVQREEPSVMLNEASDPNCGS